MLTAELHHLRSEASAYIHDLNRSCTPQEVARHIFGPKRHEDPVAALLVRAILDPLTDVDRAHDGRWLALDAPFLDVTLDDARFVVVDLETTGSLTGVDRIIEVGVAVLEGGEVVKQFSSLCHSKRHVSPRIRKLTGIKPRHLKDAPPFDEVAPVIEDLLRGAHAFVAHDVRFDMPFLTWELKRHGRAMPDMPALCTLQLARTPDVARSRRVASAGSGRHLRGDARPSAPGRGGRPGHRRRARPRPRGRPRPGRDDPRRPLSADERSRPRRRRRRLRHRCRRLIPPRTYFPELIYSGRVDSRLPIMYCTGR